MTDHFDRAAALELAQRTAALADHAARQPAMPGLLNCMDCGDEIPAARRAAMPTARRCIDCQASHEKTR